MQEREITNQLVTSRYRIVWGATNVISGVTCFGKNTKMAVILIHLTNNFWATFLNCQAPFGKFKEILDQLVAEG